MEVTQETISFLESAVFPKIAEKWRHEISNLSEQQILPHRLPLKRRLAEFRYASALSRRTSLQGGAGASSFGKETLATTYSNNTTTNNVQSSSANSPPTAIPLPPISIFSTNLWAIERFRDITPAFVIAVFDDNLVLEPGDVGPLPLRHPVAQHLIQCVNEQQMSYGLLKTLREFSAPFYDGGIVVGIVDYRRWAFGVIKSSSTPSGGITGENTANNINGSSNAHKSSTNHNNPNGAAFAPEMHKIFLKITWEVLAQEITELGRNEEHRMRFFDKSTMLDTSMPKAPYSRPGSPLAIKRSPLRSSVPMVAGTTLSLSSLGASLNSEQALLDFESKLILATSPPLCLDPNPMVSRVLTALNFDVYKMRTILHPPKFKASIKPTELASEDEYWHTNRISAWSHDNRLLPMQARGARPRFHLLTLLEGEHASKQDKKEPFYGLDARKDPSRLKLPGPPPLNWLGPGENLWRTMRFEYRLGEKPLHCTAHVIIIQLGRGTVPNTPRFEALIRIGSQPCCGDIWERSVVYPNRASVEAFIEQFKHIMQLEGKQCVADVSNPAAIHAIMRPSMESTTATPGNFLSVPLPGMTPLGPVTYSGISNAGGTTQSTMSSATGRPATPGTPSSTRPSLQMPARPVLTSNPPPISSPTGNLMVAPSPSMVPSSSTSFSMAMPMQLRPGINEAGPMTGVRPAQRMPIVVRPSPSHPSAHAQPHPPPPSSAPPQMQNPHSALGGDAVDSRTSDKSRK